MRVFLLKQWNDIKGNVKYGVLLLILAALWTGTTLLVRGLSVWQQGVILAIFAIVCIWAAVATFVATKRTTDLKASTSSRTTAPPEPGDYQITDDDPRIYLIDILDEGDNFRPNSPLVLKNFGKDVAHRVQIQTLKIGYRQIVFETIDIVPSGLEAKALPIISVGPGETTSYMFPTLKEEWNSKIKVDQFEEAFVFTLLVNYANFSNKRNFITEVGVAYRPINHEIKTRHANDKTWPHEEFKVISINHIGFRLVSPKLADLLRETPVRVVGK